MLIRHAERPSADKTTRGVTLAGKKNKEELTVRGWQRAGALARFFAPSDGHFAHPALARPNMLFACGAGPSSPSLRPQHSLLPLAELIQKEIDCRFFEGEEEPLVKAARGIQGTVLIAWKHPAMHVIANAILGDKSAVPQHWPFDRYDLVWVFERTAAGWAFVQVPQLLLAGDREDVID